MTVEGIAATSHAFESRYGRMRLTEHALHSIARQMVAGEADTVANHDPSLPMNASDIEAWVDDYKGERAVYYRMTVDRAAWDRFETTRVQAGAPGGFSFAHTELMQGEPEAVLAMFGDAADFTDDEILDLARLMGRDTAAGRLYQFGLEAEVIRFVLVVIASGVTWDVFKVGARRLLGLLSEKARRSRRAVAVDVDVRSGDGESGRSRLLIESEGDVAEALAGLERIFTQMPDSP